MTNEEAQELIDRYLQGKCSSAEISMIEAWYETLPETMPQEIDLIGQELKTAINLQLDRPKGRLINLKVISTAAAVVFFGICVVLWQYRLHNDSALAYTTLAVPAGERMNLILSDGTTVIVNGSSKIAYPEKFAAKTRAVTLIEGEAYFDVKHDAAKPFIVTAKGIRINVLGTAFNVRAYSFLKNVQVTVTRGKVSVCRPHEPVVMLLPDDQVTVQAAALSTIKAHIRADDYAGWVHGKYRFDNESLGNVASALESYYKVHIGFAEESIKDIRFTSVFENTDKFDDLLFDICRANNLTYAIKDQEIILSKKK